MNRFILTEDEKKNILNLHKKFVNEEEVQATPIQPGVYNEKIKELQDYLIQNFKSNIVADGKLGPKTLAAAQEALKTKAASTPTTTTTTSAPTQTQTLTNTETPNMTKNNQNLNNPPEEDSEQKPEYWGKNGPINN